MKEREGEGEIHVCPDSIKTWDQPCTTHVQMKGTEVPNPRRSACDYTCVIQESITIS